MIGPGSRHARAEVDILDFNDASAPEAAERWRLEEATRLNEYRYRNLFQAMAVAFWEIDFGPMRVMVGEAVAGGVTDLRAHMMENRAFVREAMTRAVVTDVNDKTVMLFEAETAEQIVGGSVAPYWPSSSEPVFVEAVMASIEKRPHFITETRLLTLQGNEIDVLFTVSWSPESRKEGVILLGVIDIGDRLRAEAVVQRLRADFAHAARISMLGELTASIAHEVNQPLAAISTNAEAALRWLERAEPDVDEVRAISRRIVADARRAAAIIERIRGMAERRMPQHSELSLSGVLDDVLLFLRHELQRHGVEVVLSAADLPPVRADRTQLQQVFVNLALNAIHAMDDAQVTQPRLTILAEARDANTVDVIFEDSGPGLSGDQHERAFETFFTTRPSGLGMGLPICRSILEAHGGTIAAEEPVAGTGARFRIVLPRIA